ncbi:acetyl esterase/lipase [Nitrobacteraceae bacterium AZCC 2146]
MDPETTLPEIPAELRALMAEVGPRWKDDIGGNVGLMIKHFSAVLKSAPEGGAAVHNNIKYGAHERQAIDVFVPQGAATPTPVVLFVHGGAFVTGDRNRTDQIYSNVLQYFARYGIAGANVGYRLANDATYPEATLDIATAARWVRDHASEFGMDPARMFLMAHSAGAAHAGSLAYDDRFRSVGAPELAGMIVVSGRVRADNLPENPNAAKVEAYYGTDSSKFDEYSPVTHINSRSIPTFVAWAEFENPLVDVYCAELAYRLAVAKRKSPPMLWLRGHNHTSSIAHINTADEALGRAIVNFVHKPT